MEKINIRKKSKKDLLEILLLQSKKIEELELELIETKRQLASKKIIIEESGSLAEASLKLNKIFECAQKTADQYLLNIKEKCRQIEEETKKNCDQNKKSIINVNKNTSKKILINLI